MSEKIQVKLRFTAWVVLISLVFLTISAFEGKVPTGHRGVITRFGAMESRVYGEGLHFVVPFVQKMHLIDISIQKAKGSGLSTSKDLKPVWADVTVNYHVSPRYAAYVYSNLGGEPGERIVQTVIDDAISAGIARFTVSELVEQRSLVRAHITGLIEEELQKYGLVIDRISVLGFPI